MHVDKFSENFLYTVSVQHTPLHLLHSSTCGFSFKKIAMALSLIPSFLFDSMSANFLLLAAWICHPTRPLWNFRRASLACSQMRQLHINGRIFFMHGHLHCRINLLEPLMPSGRLSDLIESMIAAHVGCGGQGFDLSSLLFPVSSPNISRSLYNHLT